MKSNKHENKLTLDALNHLMRLITCLSLSLYRAEGPGAGRSSFLAARAEAAAPQSAAGAAAPPVARAVLGLLEATPLPLGTSFRRFRRYFNW